MKKILILLTDHYPFGIGESFLETETTFLSHAFDRTIVISNNTNDRQTREVPENFRIYRKPFQIIKTIDKIVAIKYLITTVFIREVGVALKLYRLIPTVSLIKLVLKTMVEGERLAMFIEKVIEKEAIHFEQAFIYSYWFLKTAYSVACFNKRNTRYVCFCRAHGWDIYFHRSPSNYLPFLNETVENLDAVYFISEDGKAHIQDRLLKKHESKLKVAKLGVRNTRSFKPHKRIDTLYMVSCSSIIPLKRLNLIIKALSNITDLKITWTHIGDGYDEKNIKLLADKSLGNNTAVTCKFTGRLRTSMVCEFYETTPVDLFINVSVSEGIPVSIMEAMSFGIPVIAPKVGGIGEIVNNKNGLLIQPNPSPEEIARGIRRFCLMPDTEYALYQENAYKTWEEHYNAEKNYSSFVQNILDLKKSFID